MALATMALIFIALATACNGEGLRGPSRVMLDQQSPLSVAEIVAAPETFLLRQIRVYGQIRVQEEFSRRPCSTPNCGPEVTGVELQMVTPNRPPGGTAVLRLFRPRADGQYEPIPCTPRSGGTTAGALSVGRLLSSKGRS